MTTQVKDEIITADSFNEINDALDYIVDSWTLDKQGEIESKPGDFIRASIMNQYITWLKYYAERVGAEANLSGLPDSVLKDETYITASLIEEVKNTAYSIGDFCNKSECNWYECNISECNDTESNTSESDRYESNRNGESDHGHGNSF